MILMPAFQVIPGGSHVFTFNGRICRHEKVHLANNKKGTDNKMSGFVTIRRQHPTYFARLFPFEGFWSGIRAVDRHRNIFHQKTMQSHIMRNPTPGRAGVELNRYL